MKNFHRFLQNIVAVMPNSFDTHDAEMWYRANFPNQFAADLASCGGDEHSLSKGFGRKLLYIPAVTNTGTQLSENWRGRMSSCATWKKKSQP